MSDDDFVKCKVQVGKMEAFGMRVEGPDLTSSIADQTTAVPFLRLNGKWYIETRSGKFLPLEDTTLSDGGQDQLEAAFQDWQKQHGRAV